MPTAPLLLLVLAALAAPLSPRAQHRLQPVAAMSGHSALERKFIANAPLARVVNDAIDTSFATSGEAWQNGADGSLNAASATIP